MRFEARVLARMATGVENRDPRTLALVDGLQPGHARIVGITGPPGAGKSTLVSALAGAIRRQGKTVAIIAVDPSSRATGGAILGDRIRMQEHHADPGIFIRSMATRGTTGGLARATADMVRLMDAAGKDYVVVETVGVGQAEVEIAGLAQVTVVVLVPGMGDDVQAIKAGIMEIADIFVVNKADQPGAGQVEQELRAMLDLSDGRKAKIVQTVSTTGQGVEELLGLLSSYTPRPKPPSDQRYQSIGRVEVLGSAGLQHLVLRAPNLQEAGAKLEAQGARQLNANPHIFLDPAAGVLLELIEEKQK